MSLSIIIIVKKKSFARRNMNAAIAYTLPTIRLVCHLVVMGNSSIDDTNSQSGIIQPTSTTTTSTTTPSTTLEPSLPPGYVAYPDFGVAYKVYNESISWEVANEKCAHEGAYLAMIDSSAKIEAVINQDPSNVLKHVGFHLIESDTKWYNIRFGLSVAQTTLPWAAGEPNGSGRCAAIKGTENGLGKNSCADSMGHYVCEIVYP